MSGRRIPGTINIVLLGLVMLTMVGLLWLASTVQGWWLMPVALAFSFVFLTNYALIHEASHRTLHPNRLVNDLLGAAAGLLFPASATLLRGTHDVHHRYNRTDHEMFDCYYPGDNLLVKCAQWYSILLGLFWLIIPPGSLIVGFARPLLLTKPFKRSRSASVLYDDFTPDQLRWIRWESVLGLGLWVGLLGSGVLAWKPTALLFFAAGINWGSRQYVSHAWSPRRIADGAHNLATNPLHQAILLNGNMDVVHHLHPTVSWIHLPELARECRAPIGYGRQWLSQWRGPRPATEPGPTLPTAAPAV